MKANNPVFPCGLACWSLTVLPPNLPACPIPFHPQVILVRNDAAREAIRKRIGAEIGLILSVCHVVDAVVGVLSLTS